MPSSKTTHHIPGHTSTQRHPLHELSGAAGGAIVGAAVGAIGGPIGFATGAIFGGIVGAMMAKISDEEAARTSFHDGELDAEIGVTSGEIGASNLEHPPERRYSWPPPAPREPPSVLSEPVTAPFAQDKAELSFWAETESLADPSPTSLEDPTRKS